jgi:prefoldin beta subunit
MEEKQLLEQAQVYQQQMQGILTQKEAFNMQLVEINNALEELGKAKDNEVYRISGPILIKSSKADAEKDLGEKKELLETRIKSLEKSENTIKDRLDELREKLTKQPKKQAG